MKTANSSITWRFGVFEVDAQTPQLRRGGTPIRLREQSLRILIFLLEHAGEIVTREDLRRVLWSSDTFVDFEHSLNTAVMKLREALGDSADAPLYIETIPKRGYRFVAPVARLEREVPASVRVPDDPRGDPTVGPPQIEAPSVMPESDRSRIDDALAAVATAAALAAERLARRRRMEWIGASIGLLLIAVGAYFLLRGNRSGDSLANAHQSPSVLRIVPVTTVPGDAIAPAFSPDGREIAFAWDGLDRRRHDIYVQLLGSELPLRLTYSKSGVVGAPAWSPDGREVAFMRCGGTEDGVYVVPALGGVERKLTSVLCAHPGPLAWLPDGGKMLILDRCSATGPFGIVLLSLSTGEKRCLTNFAPLKDVDSGIGLSLSPDGKRVAFQSEAPSTWCDVFTMPVDGGRATRLTADGNASCNRLMWTADGKSIVFESVRTTLSSLWRVPAEGGPIQGETVYPHIGSISRDARLFVYPDWTSAEVMTIWRAEIANAGGPVLKHNKLVRSQYLETDAQPSPDGTRIVWMSDRTGFAELWTMNAAGGNAMQLTHLGGYAGTPRWSPDGKWIVFDSTMPQDQQIFVIDSEGRNLHSITRGPGHSVVPSWSRDGKAIYFVSKRTGTFQVWKHVLTGGGESQLTEHGGFNPFESYDGRTVYFSRFDQAGIWSVPSSGGSESLVIRDKPQVGYWGHFAVTEAGLYVLDAEADPRPTIVFYRFATHRITPVLALEQRPARLQPSLSATMDGKTLYYTQYDRQSVIKMMEFAR